MMEVTLLTVNVSYTKRNLTSFKDILTTVNGIGNFVCEELGRTLIYGLPSSHFDWALLWEARDAPERCLVKNDERFPSWSWCGWQGEMMEYKPHLVSGCEKNREEWPINHTWITWYIRDFNGNLRLVWEGDENNTAPKRKTIHGEATIVPPGPRKMSTIVTVATSKKKSANFFEVATLTTSNILSPSTHTRRALSKTAFPGSQGFHPKQSPKRSALSHFFTWSAFFCTREVPKQDFC
jgi:hypothetical protein